MQLLNSFAASVEVQHASRHWLWQCPLTQLHVLNLNFGPAIAVVAFL